MIRFAWPLVFVIFIQPLKSYGQDLILTYRGDSINCQITGESKRQIYFNYKVNGKMFTSVLSKKLVKAYQHDFFPPQTNSEEKELKVQRSNPPTSTSVAQRINEKPVSFNGYYDLIVKTNHDSLVCEIVLVDQGQIKYRFGNLQDKFLGAISLSNVLTYQRGYFQPPRMYQNEKEPGSAYFEFSGGLGHRIAKIPYVPQNDYVRHVRGLRNGAVFAVEVGGSLSQSFAFGIKLATHKSSENTRAIGLSEDVRSTYVGPVFRSRLGSSTNPDQFILGYGLGYVNYKNDAVFHGTPLTLKGNTVGIAAELSYFLARNANTKTMFGIRLALMVANVKRIAIYSNYATQSVALKDAERLSRLDLALVLRFSN